MMVFQSDLSAGRQYCAIVPAAGVGKRMGANKPKQYLQIANKTLLEWTLQRLITHPNIARIILPVSPDDTYIASLECYRAPWLSIVHGGKERADSVLAGLQALPHSTEQNRNEWVLVHDAARPCVTHNDISNLLKLAETGKHGGILASPVRDTMKRAQHQSPDLIAHSEERENLWHALTPQFFPKQQLQDALLAALQQGLTITDEASAIEQQKGTVHLVEGLSSNIKVTRPEDLPLAEFYLTSNADISGNSPSGDKYESHLNLS